MLKKKKKKKRKSIKEVSLDKPEPSGKKSRSSKDEDHVNGDSVGPAESQLSSSKLEKGLDYSNRLSEFSLKFDINGNAIPRRPRGFVGAKNDKIEGELDKTEGDQLPKKCALSGGEAKSDERSSKLPSHSAGNGVTVKVKRKRSVDDSREKKKDKVSSSQHAKEDGHVAVNNGETSSGKHLSTRNKRKDSSSRSRKSVKNDVPSGDNLGNFCQGSLNDDDEGFLQKASSATQSAERLSSLLTSDQDFVSREGNSLTGSESVSLDTTSRVLRPRQELKERGISRKRRHFYEVFPRDLDAHCLLNRRIKIFWPLDESWYYGLLNDYDPERKLHHVPGKRKVKKSANATESIDERKLDLVVDDDSHQGNCPDSEPIISWLARSSRRVKSSPSRPLKKQKTLQLSTPVVSSPVYVKTDGTGWNLGSLNNCIGRIDNDVLLPEKLIDHNMAENSFVESHSSPNDGKPVVYVRKRFRKMDGLPVYKADKAYVADIPTVSVAPVVDELQNYKSSVMCIPGPQSEKFLSAIDNEEVLRFHRPLLEAKQFRVEICLPVLPLLLLEAEQSWILGSSNLLHFPVSPNSKTQNGYTWTPSFRNVVCLLGSCLSLSAHIIISSPSFKVFLNLNVMCMVAISFLFFFLICLIKKKLVPGCLLKGTSTEFYSARFTSSTLSSTMKLGRLPPFALSFAVAPTFFICLHLSRVKCSEIAGSEDIAKTSFTGAISAGGSSFAEWQLGSLACKQQLESTRVPLKSSQNCQLDVSRSPFTAKHSELDTSDVTVVSNNLESDDQVLDQFVGSPGRRHSKNLSHRLSNARCHSGLVGMSVVIPSSDQVEGLSNGKEIIVGEACHLSLNTGDDLISSPNHTVTSDVVRSCNITGTGDRLVQSPNPSGLGGLPHRKRNNSSSSPFGEISPVWIDGKANFTGVGFAMAQRNLECRIRRASEKKNADSCGGSQRNIELLACNSNVLVTLGGVKGWREFGARIVLEIAGHNEWRIAVKFSGITKYSYKVHNVFLPDSTNHFAHAMMWKRGKDWALEFPDRSQWMLFKELHEECYKRNILAASVKNIPIPGVRLIEEIEDYASEVSFIRSSPKYYRQTESDVEMAMDPSRILYDMDSEDEQWLSKNNFSCSGESKYEEISDEFFEKAMDMFEKVAYARHRDHFAPNELEELMVSVGPMEVVKFIHEHWQNKGQKNGMTLVRHLQVRLH
ncbi:hypothetical protein KY285_033424 [Solanum tuberosum]|nr:hypothetical protein KY285_033424 [Solanum tuberosum]